MDDVGSKGGKADGHVLGAAWLGAAVADPLARLGHHRLSGPDLESSTIVLHAHHAAEHDGDLFELRPLPGLAPSGGRDHPGDAHSGVAGVHPAGILLDPLRRLPRRLDDRRSFDELWHAASLGLGTEVIRTGDDMPGRVAQAADAAGRAIRVGRADGAGVVASGLGARARHSRDRGQHQSQEQHLLTHRVTSVQKPVYHLSRRCLPAVFARHALRGAMIPHMAEPSEPSPRPFLRFYHSDELRAKTLAVLARVEQADDPRQGRAALGDLVVELTHSGIDYFFLEPLRLAEAGFLVQQTASLGMAGALKIMAPMTRSIIGRMDAPQLLAICSYIRQLMA